MRAKVNQEKLIEAGGVSYSIVRVTQFFEFLGYLADSGPKATPSGSRRPPCSRWRLTTWPPPWRTSPSARR
jgi:hypothetical protein